MEKDVSNDSLKDLENELDECVVVYNPHAKDISSKDAKFIKKTHIMLLFFCVVCSTFITYSVSYCFFTYIFNYMRL